MTHEDPVIEGLVELAVSKWLADDSDDIEAFELNVENALHGTMSEFDTYLTAAVKSAERRIEAHRARGLPPKPGFVPADYIPTSPRLTRTLGRGTLPAC